jgi:hypothetical protein
MTTIASNATSRLSNPKITSRVKESLPGLNKKEETKKGAVYSKSQRLECRMKTKLGAKSGVTNENDKNSGNVMGLNLNKEFFSKKEARKDSCNGVIVEIVVDNLDNQENNLKNITGRQRNNTVTNPTLQINSSTFQNEIMTTVSTQPNINDLNVTMKSHKDDSAIKDPQGGVFREQVLGGIIQIDTGVNMPVDVEDPVANLQIKQKTLNINKTIKSININLPSGNINSPIKKPVNSSLNLENLIINKSNIPKFTNEEYRHMFSKLIRNDYSKAILNNLFDEEEALEETLLSHKVTERMRCRMIDWMIEVLTNYRCDDFAFFYAVGILDKFFKESEKKLKVLQPADLHVVGVTAMFMASKYQDIYPLRLRVVHEKIAHKKLSVEEIKKKEEEISKTLSYIIGTPTQWDFINHFIEEIFYTSYNNFHIKDMNLLNAYLPGSPSSNQLNEKEKEAQILLTKLYTSNMINLLRHVTVYLAKMNCHDYSLAGKKPSLVSASTIYVALKICEQINKEEYVNEYFTKRLVEISKKNENDIIKCAQKILYNAQNFDTIFTGLENLKRVHFNAIIELKCTK